MGCFSKIIGFLLYILNVVFLIVGILLIVLGSIMLSNIHNYHGFDELVETNTIPILITVLGALIFLISFFGCCGVWRQSACLMATYSACMFILFVLQVALTVWIFVHRTEFLNSMSNLVTTAWNENNSTNGYPMDALELTLKCCGNINYQDYQNSQQIVPGTCCGHVSRTDTCSIDVYMTRQGCNAKFVEFWESNMDIIRWGGIGVCIFEAIVCVLASGMASSLRRRSV